MKALSWLAIAIGWLGGVLALAAAAPLSNGRFTVVALGMITLLCGLSMASYSDWRRRQETHR